MSKIQLVTAIAGSLVAVAATHAQCDALVVFQSQAPGTTYGAPAGHAPGDFVFAEGGIPVHVRQFDWGGGLLFDFSEVEPAWPNLGSGHVLHVANIGVDFDLTGLGCVRKVQFEFHDYGGVENLKVNGAPVYIGDLQFAPAVPAPGIALSVSTYPIPGGGGIGGFITLEGDVKRVLVGGQELLIDGFCVDLSCPEDIDCDGIVGFADLSSLLSSWGPCPGCPSDLDGDGMVGFADLAAFLAAWGSC